MLCVILLCVVCCVLCVVCCVLLCCVLCVVCCVLCVVCCVLCVVCCVLCCVVVLSVIVMLYLIDDMKGTITPEIFHSAMKTMKPGEKRLFKLGVD